MYQLLSDLYQKLGTQGNNLILDENLSGSQELVAQLKIFLGSNAVSIKNVVLSRQDAMGNFTVSGTTDWLQRANVAVAIDFFISQDSSQPAHDAIQCVIHVVNPVSSWNISNDYPDMPGYIDYSPQKITAGLHPSFFKAIDFQNVVFVFSSYDFAGELTQVAAQTTRSASYPGKKQLADKALRRGMNFTAEVTAMGEVWDLLKPLVGDPGKLNIIGTITDQANSLLLEISHSFGEAINFSINDSLALSLRELIIQSSLSSNAFYRPRFTINAQIANTRHSFHLSITIGIGQRWGTVTGSFADGKFLSLRDVSELLGLKALNLAQFLPDDTDESQFGNLSLKDISFDLTISPLHIENFAFALKAEKPWILLENKVTVLPSLQFTITDPFTVPDVTLDIVGIWMLGKTSFTLFASLPGGDLIAQMNDNEALDIDVLFRLLLPGVDVPKITLVGMNFSANYKDKTFSLEIQTQDEWPFDLGITTLNISVVSMMATYNGQHISEWGFVGRLSLAQVMLQVSAEYDKSLGWVVRGGTQAGEEMNLGTLFTRLLDDFQGLNVSLPANIPDNFINCAISGMFLEYHAQQKQLNFYADIVNVIKISDTFFMDTFALQLVFDPGGLNSGYILCEISLGGIRLLLQTQRQEGLAGWLFQGSTGQGQSIPIGRLIEDLAQKFGVVDLPPVLEGLTISNLGMSFSTKTKDFTFTCESTLPVDDQKVDITVTIDVTQHLDAKTQQPDGSFTTHFGGHISISNLQFDLTFDRDTTSKTFIAAYHNDAGDTVDVKELTGSFSTTVADVLPEGMQITLKDALFAYEKEDKAARFLFALDIGTPITLSGLPLVSQELPAGQSIGVENIQLLVVSQTLEKENVASLNLLLQKSGAVNSLPARALERGFSLSTIASVGEVKKALALSLEGKHVQQSTATSSELQQGSTDTQAESVSSPAASSSSPTAWISIQRSLGPLYFEKIGFRLSAAGLSLVLDTSVSLARLSVVLEGLSATIPLHAPFTPQFSLQGLGITYQGGPVEISSELVEVQKNNVVEYDGTALIAAEDFTISALGSYTTVNGHPSLFVFALLDKPLGGPAFFYVTGLAVGFGYNRTLVLPDQNSVPQFPLVAGVSDPAVLGGQREEDGSWKMPDPATALSSLADTVQPADGVYWLAAGVRFTSFDLIHSTALLVVEFGNELEIAVLGLSWISLPPPASPDASAPVSKYAYAELGIEIKLLPAQGVLTASAILAPNSFVIDPACKLTGGFAFSVWFGDNPHAGEFVVTLGGYHPNFKVPSHYPMVPRLGFNWPVSSDVTISGDAYFALTPSAVMAGGGLQVLFSSGDLRAWFRAQMDALIEWAPFHFLIDISVSIGASYRLNLLFVTVTLKVELGADLTIWGPPMGGKVQIDWYVISFTIYFGAHQDDRPAPLEWTNNSGTGFAQTFLPHQTPGTDNSRTAGISPAGATTVGEGPTADQQGGIYTISVNDGLLQTFTNHRGNPVWIVRPNHFVFSTLTAIPATQIVITPTTNEDPKVHTTITAQSVSPDGQHYFVCIRPMKATLISSVFTVTLADDDDGSVYDLAAKFDYEIALSSMPAAKWGKPLADAEEPEQNALLGVRVLGLKNVTPKLPTLTPNGNDALDIDVATAFTYDVVDTEKPYTSRHLPLQPALSPVGSVPRVDGTALQQIQLSLMQPDRIPGDQHGPLNARNAIFAVLQEYGIDPGTNGALHTLAANPGAYLTGNPLLSRTSTPPIVGGV